MSEAAWSNIALNAIILYDSHAFNSVVLAAVEGLLASCSALSYNGSQAAHPLAWQLRSRVNSRTGMWRLTRLCLIGNLHAGAALGWCMLCRRYDQSVYGIVA